MLDSRSFIVRTLLADRVITDADLRRASEHANSSSTDVLTAMTQLGIVSARRLAIATAKICEYPFVDLAHYEVDFANCRLIPRNVAERLTAFPIFVIDGVATVAMLDPLNLQAIDQVRQLLRCDVDPVLADSEQLRALIARAYSLGQSQVAADEAPAEAGELTTGEEPIVAAVNQIISGAVEAGASDVHLNPEERDLILRYRVDGALRKQQGPPRSSHEAMVQRLKVLARLDLTQTRRPQDGKFRFRHKGEAVDIRLSIIPTILGENVVMRLLRSGTKIGGIESLGMSKDMTRWFEEAIGKPHGIVLVTGPTGSGKTTTLYTALSRLNHPDVNIMTIEDPVEIRLPLVRQVQVNPEVGLTFASALRTILRQDPDVVLVGEIRDQETAKIAIQAAMTGHLVFSTLHTNDAVGTIARLRDLELPAYAINGALLCALAQRLVRRLCPQCAVPDTANPCLPALPEQYRAAPFRTAPGCAACRQTGVRGRLGVFEMLRMTSRVQQVVAEGAPPRLILDAARSEGMRSLEEDALDKAAAGLVGLDEVLRLSSELEEDGASVAPSARRAA